MKYIKEFENNKKFKFKFGDIVKINFNHMYDNDIFEVIFVFAGLDGNYYQLKSLITNKEMSHTMEKIIEFADEEQIAALKYNL